ncbi:hypothetical protein JMN32_10025 [Fulvivirga sp. 29W222]|uniref:Uncharacterized protein n=1 Tax=Fulvivirga marina TaxID=2494733 RepID=A0A937FVC8_9BACT|nr:hypothetical protein [Fulvivirga marina]MBL6446649.1 hypothetical protein [Fulvivirga marina]
MDKTPDKPILVRIADKLKETQQEVDELVLQFSLGKAEARDKFEEIKTELKLKVAEFKQSAFVQHLSTITLDIKRRLEVLEQHLNLGQADTSLVFEEQKSKITHAIEQLEAQLKKLLPEEREYFEQELEKFKIKLEILRLWFSLKKIEVKASFKGHMKEARERIDKLVENARSAFASDKGDQHNFKHEIGLAYDHLKKAVHSLT